MVYSVSLTLYMYVVGIYICTQYMYGVGIYSLGRCQVYV